MSIPGWVDIQVNGQIGTDFSDPNLTAEKFLESAKHILDSGTFLFLPTIVTSPYEVYRRNIGIIRDAVDRAGLRKHIPGVHLEGPFISDKPGAVGAHNPAYVRKPDVKFFDQIMAETGFVKMMTVAAEAEGADAFIRHAVKCGVNVGIGHHLANYAQCLAAEKAGATSLTHLGNGVPNTINRHKNPIWSGLACDGLTATIITDSHHLPPELIKCVVRMKGPEKIVVISDAASVAGLPPGRYSSLGNDAILEPDGLFHNPVKQCLVGSSANMTFCMKYLKSLNLLTDSELEQVGYYNPLRLIGINPGR